MLFRPTGTSVESLAVYVMYETDVCAALQAVQRWHLQICKGRPSDMQGRQYTGSAERVALCYPVANNKRMSEHEAVGQKKL